MIGKKENPERPIYIGSAGKIRTGGGVGRQSLRSRLDGAYVPYYFDEDRFYYHLLDEKKRKTSAGYEHSIPLNELKIVCFDVPAPTAPAVWEHLLLQGFINQFGDLPTVNRQL